jgi:isoleucyl-tRNA synthetase
LVKKKSAATWCPRCETGLSQHEEADGYKEITDISVYLKFKLKDRPNEYVLAWTTTPWTLSANVLLAINTDFEYVKAKVGNDYLYSAKLAADRLGLTDYEKIDAQTLLNLEYDSLYDIPAQKGVKHFVTNWDLVNPAEGTGVVHIAPGCGQEDFELGKKLGSAMVAPLDTRGHFLDGYGELSGLYAHDIAPLVFKYLKKTGAFFKTEEITHRYPHCWRCKTKCLFRLEDSWFIKSDEIRPLLKEAAKKVTWHPKYAGRRMQNWLDTMEDWMINRKRFYGLALPFYKCSCGELAVIGSLEELKEKAINPELIDKLPSLHRPWIDEIKIKCPKCGKIVDRIPDVGDVWLDAGVVPFSTLKYLTDKTYWQKWFPADMVLEMTEQVRLWFYSMLFFSVTLEGIPPYKIVVTHAEVRDEKNERMSKTKHNGIPYEDAVSKMGTDAMRWLYCQQKPAANVNFGFNIADQVKREFFLILWNSYRFFTQHANLDSWEPSANFNSNNCSEIIDQWILSRLHHTIEKVTQSLDKYGTSVATKSLEEFVSDLSTWYIRRNRERTDNLDLLFYIFNTLAVLLAPFIPYIGEILFQNLSGFNISESKITVHTQNWPEINGKLINIDLETQMKKVRDICQLIHAERQKATIKIRQPLPSATINTKLTDDLINIIREETNVKEIILGQEISLNIKLTPELIAEGEYRDFVRSVQVLRRETGLLVQDKIKIFAPTWPQSFEKEILTKTLSVSIEKSDSLRIEKIS